MTPEQAADLAARTLAAINDAYGPTAGDGTHYAADRERVASDLRGIELVQIEVPQEDGSVILYNPHSDTRMGWMHALFVDGLLRTAALYGVTP